MGVDISYWKQAMCKHSAWLHVFDYYLGYDIETKRATMTYAGTHGCLECHKRFREEDVSRKRWMDELGYGD